MPVQPFFQMMFQTPATRAVRATNPFSSKIKRHTFKETWLSDSATYPLIVCLLGAGAFIVGCTMNAFANNKDVRISSSIKHQVIRDWGQTHTKTITEAVGTKPLVNAQRYKTIGREGLGVDHNEWKRQKAAEQGR